MSMFYETDKRPVDRVHVLTPVIPEAEHQISINKPNIQQFLLNFIHFPKDITYTQLSIGVDVWLKPQIQK